MISFLCLLIVGIFKALSDLSSEGVIYPKGESWKNKWLLDSSGNIIKEDRFLWYYPINKPQYKERFIYSSTFLVSLTDFWHKTELARSIAQVSAVIFYSTFHSLPIDAAMMFICYMVGFSITYEPIKRKAKM